MNNKILLFFSALLFSGCYTLGLVDEPSSSRTAVERGNLKSFFAEPGNVSLVRELLGNLSERQSLIGELQSCDSMDAAVSYNLGAIYLDEENYPFAEQYFAKAIELLEQSGVPCVRDTGRSRLKAVILLKSPRAPEEGACNADIERVILPSFKSYLLGNLAATDMLRELRTIENRKIGEPRYSCGAGLFLQFNSVYGIPSYDPALIGYPGIVDQAGRKRFREEVYAGYGLAAFLSKDIQNLKEWRQRTGTLGITSSKIEVLWLISDWLNNDQLRTGQGSSLSKFSSFLTNGG